MDEKPISVIKRLIFSTASRRFSSCWILFIDKSYRLWDKMEKGLMDGGVKEAVFRLLF